MGKYSNFSTGQLSAMLQLVEKAYKQAARVPRGVVDTIQWERRERETQLWDDLRQVIQSELTRRNESVVAQIAQLAGRRCRWCKGWVPAGEGHDCLADSKASGKLEGR